MKKSAVLIAVFCLSIFMIVGFQTRVRAEPFIGGKPFNSIAKQLFDDRGLVLIIAESQPLGGRKQFNAVTGVIVAKEKLKEGSFRYFILSVAHLTDSLGIYGDKKRIPDFKAFFTENNKFAAPLKAEARRVYWLKDLLLLTADDNSEERFNRVMPFEISAKRAEPFDTVYLVGYFWFNFFAVAEGYVLPDLNLKAILLGQSSEKEAFSKDNDSQELGDLRIWLYRAEIGVGMSGGPIINVEGKLVGINQAVISAESQTMSGHLAIGVRIDPSFNYLKLEKTQELKNEDGKGGEDEILEINP